MTERLTAKCKWFNGKKGFGFLDTGNGDLFVHISELPEGTNDLKEGQSVSYTLGKTAKGPCATNIEIAA